MQTTTKTGADISPPVAAAKYAAHKTLRNETVRVQVGTHRLQEHVAARLAAELTGASSPSQSQPEFRHERAARRAFGAVLTGLVCHELDDELFKRVISKHPRCARALDDLLNDLQFGTPQMKFAEIRQLQREQDEFDALVDNDRDGLS